MITAGCGSLVRAPGPLLRQRVARVVVAGVVLELVLCSAPSASQSVFTITEKAPTRAFFWLKVATTAFTFKTLLRHYAKRALIPRSLNVKLGPRRKGHKGRAVWLS